MRKKTLQLIYFLITEKEKNNSRYKPKDITSRLLLFGSAFSDSPENRDINIAVEGIADKGFYALYGNMLYSLTKLVDVVDLF